MDYFQKVWERAGFLIKVMRISNTSEPDFINLVGNGTRSHNLSYEEYFFSCYWIIFLCGWNMEFIVLIIAKFTSCFCLFTKIVGKLHLSHFHECNFQYAVA